MVVRLRGLTVSGLDLCINLDAAIFWNHLFGDGDALMDRNALLHNGVVLHTAVPSAVLRELSSDEGYRAETRRGARLTWTC